MSNCYKRNNYAFRDAPNAVDRIASVLPRLHALVLGPGLGRNQSNLDVVAVSLYYFGPV